MRPVEPKTSSHCSLDGRTLSLTLFSRYGYNALGG